MLLPTTASATPSLSAEQERVRRIVLDEGRSCFLTGCGGTGKSFLTNLLVSDLQRKYGRGAVGVTATTGIAACHLRGTTLHSFAGIGLGQASGQELVRKLRRDHVQRWRATKVLVVDEVSMLDGRLFDKIEYVARKARGSDDVFGGVQLLLVGDFAQLPPVGAATAFCFEARCWSSAVDLEVELRTVFRQANAAFVDMLNSIRVGVCTEDMVERLNATVVASSSSAEPTKLFARNVDVDAINAERLAALPGDAVEFEAHDAGSPSYREMLGRSCLAPSLLRLKPGARVVLLQNIDVERGLSNGTRGVFLEAVEVVAAADDEGEGAKKRPRLDVVVVSSKALLVRFDAGADGTVIDFPITKHSFSFTQGDVVLASRTQYPLKLAYAMTIHKCQGMTLSSVELALHDVFEYGQAYVALSRVTDLGGLRLVKPITSAVVRCHPKVLEFYGRMRKKWAQQK